MEEHCPAVAEEAYTPPLSAESVEEVVRRWEEEHSSLGLGNYRWEGEGHYCIRYTAAVEGVADYTHFEVCQPAAHPVVSLYEHERGGSLVLLRRGRGVIPPPLSWWWTTISTSAVTSSSSTLMMSRSGE